MMKRFRGVVLRILISAGAIALIIYSMRDKLHEALAILAKEVQWEWFAAAVVAYLFALTILAMRLKSVLDVHDIKTRVREALHLTGVGLFFNLFFPSAVGGDIAKAYYTYKHSGKKIESTTAVILDRLMGFVALILMAVFGLLFFSAEIGDNRVNNLIYLFLAIMIFSMLFFGSKRFARIFSFLKHLIPSQKIKHRLSDLYHAMYEYKKHKMTLLWTIGLSFFGQSIFILVHYLIARSLGVHISPWMFFVIVPVIAIVSMAPSIGGLGVREAGVIFFFKKYMVAERALALSVLLDILIYGFSIAAGIIFAFRGGLKKRELHEMEKMEEET